MRRPGENPVLYAIGGVIGRMFHNRHAGPEHSILTLLPVDGRLAVTSTSFPAGGVIPDVHAAALRGGNVSPQLAWTGVPAGTQQLLLVMEDADVPLSRPAIHTAGVFPPTIASFAEGALTPDAAGVRFLSGRFGRVGYHGPYPPANHGPHRYDFIVYALDEPLPETITTSDVEPLAAALTGHVLASGVLSGTHEG